MVLLSYKQALDLELPSKLIIVALGINANNEGHGIVLIHMGAKSAPKDDPGGNIRTCQKY